MQKVDIGVYILLGICIIGILVNGYLKIDMVLLSSVTTALLGIVLGRNSAAIAAGAKNLVAKFKK
jgi:hypothetical protein